jgi:hypothetical protein
MLLIFFKNLLNLYKKIRSILTISMKIRLLILILILLISWVLYEEHQLNERKQQFIATTKAIPIRQLDPKPRPTKKIPLDANDKRLLDFSEADNAPQPAPEWSNISKKIASPMKTAPLLDEETATTIQQENLLLKP